MLRGIKLQINIHNVENEKRIKRERRQRGKTKNHSIKEMVVWNKNGVEKNLKKS